MDAKTLITCHERIKGHVLRTPVLSSEVLNSLAGTRIFFKCENFQSMGAYKLRGAVHAILRLPEKDRERGVVTHSSGNFAQALALAAANLGVSAIIIMPSTASPFKKKAVIRYGGKVVECDPTHEAREAMAETVRSETGATFIHPSNDLQVILGQGTACLELLEDQPDLNAVFVPVGGGGLLAGTALAAHFLGRNCQAIGGEPVEADDAYRSFYSGVLQGNTTTNTIADGLKTMLGDVSFPIIQEYAHDIVRVTEEEIISSMRLMWEELKITAEPSSAVALAALLNSRGTYTGKRTGIIVSGGNVDLNNLPFH